MLVQLVVAAGNRKGQTIPIVTEKFIIGRAEDCDLQSRSELMSRYHCALLVGNDVSVRDLGSKNGVRLNGERIQTEHKLENGDKLTVGPLEFFLHVVADGIVVADGVVPTGDEVCAESDADGCRFPGSGQTGIAPSDVTVLLDQLKSLNQEKETESPSSVPRPLKGIL